MEMNHLEIIERKPEGAAHPKPILFVHGSWHGAWCWDEFFLPYFAKQGFHVKALSLRGHGKSSGRDRLRTCRVKDYVEDVSTVVNSFETPPVLVGHSLGGLVVQKYLELTDNPFVSKAVLQASVPPHGVWKTAWCFLTKHPIAFFHANLTLRLFPLISTMKRFQECFFPPDMPTDQLEKYFSKIQDESYMTFLDMLILSLPKPQKVSTPVIVLGGEKDTIFSTDEVAATARAYQTRAKIFKNMTHDMMLHEDWQQVADYIIKNI